MANSVTRQRNEGSERRHIQGASPDQTGNHGVVRDERGQDQPKDRKSAQRTSGQKAQKDAAQSQPQSPGEPAGGE